MQTTDSGTGNDGMLGGPADAPVEVGALPTTGEPVMAAGAPGGTATAVAPEPVTRPLPVVGGTGVGRTGGGFAMDAYLGPVQNALTPLESVGRQTITWIGSALLALGVILLPVASFSILFTSASFKMWDVSHFVWFVLLLCAVASAGLAYLRDYKWLWATGGIALLLLLYKFVDLMTTSFISISWGWIVLFPAALLILAAAAMRPNPSEASGDARAYVNDMVGRFSNK